MSATKERIIALPNEHLRQRSKRIGVITPEVKQVVTDMQAATLDWEDSRDHEIGVALAAIQIDQPLRIIVIRNNFEDKTDRTFGVFINPVITKYEGPVVEDFEGCLSVPSIYGKIPRYSKVRIKAMDLDGREFRLSVNGFLARIFQHEIDHMNGIVFIDHIKNKPKAFFHLTEDGQLEAIDYEKDVKNSRLLW